MESFGSMCIRRVSCQLASSNGSERRKSSWAGSENKQTGMVSVLTSYLPAAITLQYVCYSH